LSVESLNLSDERIRFGGQVLDLLSHRSRDAGTAAARCRPASGTAGTGRDPEESVEEVQLLVERLGLGEQAIGLVLQCCHLILDSRGKAASAGGTGELALEEENLAVEGLSLSQDGIGLHHHACHLLRDDGGATPAGAAAAQPGELSCEEVGPVVDRPRLGKDAVGL
jgi:hypothetical protein